MKPPRNALFQTCRPLILASSSPRRLDLLRDMGLDFTVLQAMVEETPHQGETAACYARRMAAAKAGAVAAAHPQAWVIGADTVVTLGAALLGKPRDRNHALDMLRTLAGTTHQVLTAVTLCGRQEAFCETLIDSTEVTFNEAADRVLLAYIDTGEPLDKAGAYGIQGIGSFLVREIRGSYTNVVGLPLDLCLNLLQRNRIIDILSPPPSVSL